MYRATTTQTRVEFFRICVKLSTGGKFPNQVKFIDDFGKNVYQEVSYEWLPLRCIKCKVSGYSCASTTKDFGKTVAAFRGHDGECTKE